jgi:transcriptional regulator with XRE-family HTH domain
MGSPSENIRAARVRAGLQPEDIARAAGLNKPSYYDVEASDDEVTGNISLATLTAIARYLGTTAVELLEGPGTHTHRNNRPMSELVALAKARMAVDHLTIEGYGDRFGWNLAPIFEDPRRVSEYPLEMLQALCEDCGADWKQFLDGSTSPG